MTDQEICSLANKGEIATADFDIGKTFRTMVVPKFLLDVDLIVGVVHWRRAVWNQAITSASRNYDLPDDWERFEKLKLKTAAGLEDNPLSYIGEDDDAVLQAEASTTQAKPSSYYVVAGDPKRWAIRLGQTPDAVYSVLGIYYRTVPFPAATEDGLDLDPYIPAQYQAAPVLLTRAQIFLDRYGFGDGRYTAAMSEYKDFVLSMAQKKEPAPRGRAVFVR